MQFKTCVTIAEDSIQKIKKRIKDASKKSDYVEVRFDFLSIQDIPKTLESIKKDLKKIVCTLRPKSEGGEFSGKEHERISILKLIAEYNPFLLDVEYNTLKKNPKLVKYLKSTNTNLLISWHSFKGTPSFSELKKLYNKMKKFSSHVKIVTFAKDFEDLINVLKLYEKRNKKKLIAFSMGDEGRISRILCINLGSPFTYVSLGKPIAKGQFSLDEIKALDVLNFQTPKK